MKLFHGHAIFSNCFDRITIYHRAVVSIVVILVLVGTLIDLRMENWKTHSTAGKRKAAGGAAGTHPEPDVRLDSIQQRQ